MFVEKFTEFRKKKYIICILHLLVSLVYLYLNLTLLYCTLFQWTQSLIPAGNVLHYRVVSSAPMDARKHIDEGLDWRDAKGTTHERDRNSPPLLHSTHLPGASKPCPCGLSGLLVEAWLNTLLAIGEQLCPSAHPPMSKVGLRTSSSLACDPRWQSVSILRLPGKLGQQSSQDTEKTLPFVPSSVWRHHVTRTEKPAMKLPAGFLLL